MKQHKDWMDRILNHLGQESIPKWSVICSLHFSSEDFLRKPSGKIALKETAVPELPSSLNQVAVYISDSSVIPCEASEQNTINVSVDSNEEMSEPPQKKVKYQLASNVAEVSDHQFLSPCKPCSSWEKMSSRKEINSDISSRTVTVSSLEGDISSRTVTATFPGTISTLTSSETDNTKTACSSPISSPIEKVTRIVGSNNFGHAEYQPDTNPTHSRQSRYSSSDTSTASEISEYSDESSDDSALSTTSEYPAKIKKTIFTKIRRTKSLLHSVRNCPTDMYSRTKAEECWHVANKTISDLKIQIKSLQHQNRRFANRIQYHKSLFHYLEKNNLLNQHGDAVMKAVMSKKGGEIMSFMKK